MPPQLFTQTGLFRGKNIQVTSGTVKQARSESIIAANPANPFNLIAASKKFSNPQTYRFTIGVRVSFTGGSSWLDATLPVLQEWGDMVGGECGFQRIGLLTFTPPEFRDRLEARVVMHRDLGVDSRLISPDDARELDPSLYVFRLFAHSKLSLMVSSVLSGVGGRFSWSCRLPVRANPAVMAP